MSTSQHFKLLSVIATALFAAGSPTAAGNPRPIGPGAQGEHAAQEQGQEPGSSQAQGGGQGEAGAQGQGGQSAGQEPDQEKFRLSVREQLGEGGQSVRVGATQFIFNDVFDFTDVVNDLFVWARVPTISGSVEDNAFVGGQRAEVSSAGRVGGDLFMFAQTGRIDGAVDGDLYAFVADLIIADSGGVAGAMYGSSGTLTVNGAVGGPIIYAGGTIRLNGIVHGDVSVEAGNLELGPDARIEGNLRYESAREAEIAAGAVVDGETIHSVPQTEQNEDAEATSWFSFWRLVTSVWWYVATFLVGALALAIGGDAARRPAACLASQPALGLGFGFVVAVVLPAAAIVAVIMLVTLPLGLIALVVYCLAVYMARLVTAQTIGDRLLRLLRSGVEPSAYASLALGLVLFYFLTKIPYVGFLIWLAAIVAGLGGIFLALRRAQTPPPSPAAAPIP